MNALLACVFSSTGAIGSLALIGFWLHRSPRSNGARRALYAAAMFYLVAGTYVVPALASRLLASNYRPFTAADKPAAPTALVVLGSGAQVIRGWEDRLDLATDVEAARVLETARVFRLLDPPIIVSSGGLPSPSDDSQPSGQNMHDELVRLGVPDSRIIVETESANTHDEARVVTALLHSRGIQAMVLVTSESHMMRSMGVFRTYGWNPVPAIAPHPDFNAPWDVRWIPSGAGLEFSRQIARELIGLPYYWARGWWRL